MRHHSTTQPICPDVLINHNNPVIGLGENLQEFRFFSPPWQVARWAHMRHNRLLCFLGIVIG